MAAAGTFRRMAVPMPALDGVEHRFLDLPTGVRAHVAIAGPEDAPPVLAVHGWPKHWWCWHRVIEQLDGAVRIACPDLRGFGWSSAPEDGDFTKPRLVGDALATLDALGWERALYVGHDWGAVVGYLAALRAPERLTGLLAIGAPHPWQPPARILRNAWRFAYQLPLVTPFVGAGLMRDGRLPAAMMRAAQGEEGALTDAELEPYLAVLREPGPAGATEQIYRQFLLRDLPGLRGRVNGRRLEVPTRALCGRREPLGTEMFDGLERHADDARVEIADGAGHWVPEEAPELVAEHIRAMA